MDPHHITIHGKAFKRTIDSTSIAQKVQWLADAVATDLAAKDPLILVVLRGAFVFAADLIRHLDFDPEIEFVQASSYDGLTTTGEVRVSGMPDLDTLKGRTVVIIEDIIESGLTLQKLKGVLLDHGASEVRIAAMFFKPAALRCEFQPDYVGFVIPDAFIIGYGLDYNGRGRSLKSVYALSSDE
jgi:hypoxanthine phosphoribosyltransferase